MNELKKLLTFEIKDEFSLSEDELRKRAELVAIEHASENGWSDIAIDFSNAVTNTQEDKFKFYTVDVYGVERDSENTNTSSSKTESTLPRRSNGIAAQPL